MDFTSHNHAEHRLKRLKKVADLFCEISGIPRDHADGLICVLKDDKGVLEVHWRYGPPSHRQREGFSSAWRLAGEKPEAVKHYPDF